MEKWLPEHPQRTGDDLRESSVQAWVESFRSQQGLYELFGRRLQGLLASILQEESVPIHSITYRVKDPARLEEKLSRPGKSYDSLTDVTDLLGLRIITYFANDVDRVVAVVDRELEIDLERSADKRPLNDPDRFGYASVHRVCKLPQRRTQLAEYRAFAGLRCEIQIRSILQHAWAEIEHDLGYKVARGIPVHLRRRFSLLAGLLELADDQFMRLRDELTQYSAQVTDQVQTRPEQVAIDSVSLERFIQTNPLLQQLDQELSEMRGRPLTGPTKAVVEARVEELESLGITTVKELAETLEDCQELVRALAGEIYRTDPRRGMPMSRGGALVLLVQVLIGRSDSLQEIRRRLEQFGISSRGEREARARLLQQIVRGA
ncbi:MAG: GTP pyrophosphokinase [Bacillota bacterium]